MNEKKIQMPEGMLEAVVDVVRKRHGYNPSVRMVEALRENTEAALRQLSKNPIVPTTEQSEVFSSLPVNHEKPYEDANYHHCPNGGVIMWPSVGAVEWQRCMFLAPEPSIAKIYVYACSVCGMRVASSQNFHINDRPTCVQCNAEMEPYLLSQEISQTERDIIDTWLKRHQPNGSRVSLVGDAMAEELLSELEKFRRDKESK